MKLEGHLDKMVTTLADVVHYQLPIDEQLIDLNQLVGQKISLNFLGKIHCMSCGKQTKTSFGQGYCYNCYNTIPETDDCVLRPEMCKAHLGVARDIEWSKQHCLTEHIVYLAFTGNVKVGVTRHSQVPTRWIDQGATQAIQLATTPNRNIAGLIEVFMKQHFSDKTSWQQMLLYNSDVSCDLLHEKKLAMDKMPDGLKKFIHPNNEITTISYPMDKIPSEIKSTNLDKTSAITGILTGIKGQYLIFDNKTVMNVRTHRGYLIALEY